MTDDPTLSELLERCRQDHQAWNNGDGSHYELPEDGTILGAVGGYGHGGTDGDLACLALVERGRSEFVTDPEGAERRWGLRVTEVFRTVDGVWHRIHRHADPLVDRQELAEVTSLLE